MPAAAYADTTAANPGIGYNDFTPADKQALTTALPMAGFAQKMISPAQDAAQLRAWHNPQISNGRVAVEETVVNVVERSKLIDSIKEMVQKVADQYPDMAAATSSSEIVAAHPEFESKFAEVLAHTFTLDELQLEQGSEKIQIHVYNLHNPKEEFVIPAQDHELHLGMIRAPTWSLGPAGLAWIDNTVSTDSKTVTQKINYFDFKTNKNRILLTQQNKSDSRISNIQAQYQTIDLAFNGAKATSGTIFDLVHNKSILVNLPLKPIQGLSTESEWNIKLLRGVMSFVSGSHYIANIEKIDKNSSTVRLLNITTGKTKKITIPGAISAARIYGENLVATVSDGPTNLLTSVWEYSMQKNKARKISVTDQGAKITALEGDEIILLPATRTDNFILQLIVMNRLTGKNKVMAYPSSTYSMYSYRVETGIQKATDDLAKQYGVENVSLNGYTTGDFIGVQKPSSIKTSDIQGTYWAQQLASLEKMKIDLMSSISALTIYSAK